MRRFLPFLPFLSVFSPEAPFPWKYQDLPQISESQFHRVGPEGSFSVLATYHVQPESADGKYVAYTRLLDPVVAHNKPVAAEVWVVDRTTGTERKILEGLTAGPHSGANVSWASGHLLISKAVNGYALIDVDTGEVQARMDWWANDYSPRQDRIIGWGGGWPEPTIYGYDVKAKRETSLVTREDLAPFAEAMKATSAPSTWNLGDTRWAPDGRHFSFHCSSGALGKSLRFLFIAEADGKNIRFFAEKEWGEKPMHDGWYDDRGLFGHDDRHFNVILREKRSTSELTPADFAMKVWDFDGSIRIPRLAPPGCHGSVSPDRRFTANESWYTTNPIEFNVYPIGKDGGWRVFSSGFTKVVWDLRAHVNPVFSRDSKRLYFNRPVADDRTEVWWVDLADL